MNDDINLDLVFKNSIILDIVKASLSLLCSGFQMVYFRLDESRINECKKVEFDATKATYYKNADLEDFLSQEFVCNR